MDYTPEFWGPQGRVGTIGAGEWQGRYLFVYPDTRPEWWTFFVAPSPYDHHAGDHYVHGNNVIESVIDGIDVTWLERDDQEQEIEKRLFGQRPLLGYGGWLRGGAPTDVVDAG